MHAGLFRRFCTSQSHRIAALNRLLVFRNFSNSIPGWIQSALWREIKKPVRDPCFVLSVKQPSAKTLRSFYSREGGDELKGTYSEQTRHQIRARQRFPPQILDIRKTPQCEAPRRFMYTEGMTGIEPASSVWKTEALPLSYIPTRTR